MTTSAHVMDLGRLLLSVQKELGEIKSSQDPQAINRLIEKAEFSLRAKAEVK
jgi:hypothetical protein